MSLRNVFRSEVRDKNSLMKLNGPITSGKHAEDLIRSDTATMIVILVDSVLNIPLSAWNLITELHNFYPSLIYCKGIQKEANVMSW